MRPSEMLNKITSLLGTKVELGEMKLENGTTIEADNFASGESVFIITEDEKVPLPVGDYNLEDGKILVVEEEGIISSIGEATEAEEEKEQEELDSQIATGAEPRDLEAEKDTEVVAEVVSESPKKKESKKDLSEDESNDENVSLEEEEKDEKDEMNKIVEEVVAAVTPIIDEMKQELAYVKEELGKIKGEEDKKVKEDEELKEQLSSQPATKPLKHNPESKPETKAILSKGNRPLGTMDRVLSKLNQ